MHMQMQKYGLPTLALLIGTLVFSLQSQNIGFWTPHHGWTSVHGLALFAHATPESGLVGYSQAFRQADGEIDYDYFDRYPFFFSAFAGMFLRITDDLPTEIMIMRHLMNAIFLLTMLAAYGLVRRLGVSRVMGAAITILAFSSYSTLYYKDMIHFDQPALLMMLVLITAIMRHVGSDPAPRWQVYAVALAAVVIGRGYASFFVLGLWLAIEALCHLRKGAIGAVMRADALWVTVIAVVWASMWLGYNVLMEARLREVAINETSIVDSALRRLPFLGFAVTESEAVHSSDKGLAGWAQFLAVQTERTVLWFTPAQFAGTMHWRFVPLEDTLTINTARLGAGIALVVVVMITVARQSAEQRMGAALLAFGGTLWTVFMINLTTKHDYVTMYEIGLVIVGYVGLLGGLDRIGGWGGTVVRGGALAISVGLFGYALVLVRDAQHAEIAEARAYTADFNRSVGQIDGDKQTVYLAYDYYKPECIINNDLCFALGYYLSDHYLTTHFALADYLLSPRWFHAEPRFVDAGESVTLLSRPVSVNNERAFLFDRRVAVERPAPTEGDPVFRYGDHLTVQGWSLDGSITVEACEHVVIESWWRTDAELDANYHMQITMVDDAGGAIAAAGAPLGMNPTRLWEEGRYTLDARPVVVPCDTPAGSYPLIMGVSDPKAGAILPAYGGDGAPLGNQAYLTTVVVSSG